MQHWSYALQVIELLIRDKGNPLQNMQPTQIALDWHGLGDAYKRGVGSKLSMPKEGSDGVEYGRGRVHDIHGVW